MAIAVKRLAQVGHPIHDGLAIEDDRGIAVDAVLHRFGKTYRGPLNLLLLPFIHMRDTLDCLAPCSVSIARQSTRELCFEPLDTVDFVDLYSVYLVVGDNWNRDCEYFNQRLVTGQDNTIHGHQYNGRGKCKLSKRNWQIEHGKVTTYQIELGAIFAFLELTGYEKRMRGSAGFL